MAIPLQNASPSILPTVAYAAIRLDGAMVAAAILALDSFGAPVEFVWNVAAKPENWAWPEAIARASAIDELFLALCREMTVEPSVLLLESDSELRGALQRRGPLLPVAVLNGDGVLSWVGQAPFPGTTSIALAEGIVAQLGLEPFGRIDAGLEQQRPWSLDEV